MKDLNGVIRVVTTCKKIATTQYYFGQQYAVWTHSQLARARSAVICRSRVCQISVLVVDAIRDNLLAVDRRRMLVARFRSADYRRIDISM
jgi:hypothetical protein